MRPFADESRTLGVGLALALLVAMGGWYSYLAIHVVFGYRQCVAAGASADGRSLTFPLWVVTGVDGPDRYRVSKVLRDVPVEGPTEGLAVGQTVSVMGDFRAADLVVVEELREVHHLRKWKEGLGILGFVVALAAAPFSFRVRARRLVERG